MDLARAFIANDPDGFLRACVPAGFGRKPEYDAFLAMVKEEMESIQRGETPVPAGPVRITHLYKARHLTNGGPGSAGFAMRAFEDVMFVDVVAEQTDGSTFTNRTLVFQRAAKQWQVMPRPDLFPLFSTGLNEESDSTELWAP